MEGEINPLAYCCRELFPMMDMVESLRSAVGLPVGKTTLKLSTQEDNVGALILALTLPPQHTP